MRLTSLLLWAAAFGCGMWSSLGMAQGSGRPKAPPPPPPLFTGQEFPVPPQQKEAWTPPKTKLPDALISTTKFLFEHGCADPRGCEYRKVTLVVGGVWGGHGYRAETHGWLLPATASKGERYAIGWNGLVYPVLESGDAVSLTDDIIVPEKWERWVNEIGESNAVGYESPLPVRVCLLLRLGEVDLAEKLWEPSASRMGQNNAAMDPFDFIAHDWLWYAFDRAVCAHMRGDHRLSLLTAEPLAANRAAFEAEAKIRQGNRGEADRNQRRNPNFDFLEPLDRLLADQQRRVALEPVVRVLGAPKETYADQTVRIKALVRDLEEVSARQWGQPGGVSLAEDPIVQALEAEGDAAVEPLLACLENDDRLTRSVSFHRDFFTNRNLIEVHQAALSALYQILQTQSFGIRRNVSDRTPDGLKAERKKLASEIRDYWAKRSKLSKEEGWFLTLQDDMATSKQWLEAASRITMPADVRINGAWISTPPRKPGEIPPIAGESLRNKTNPSLTELLAKRSDQVASSEAAHENSTARHYEYQTAMKLSLCLARWDQKASLPTLQARIQGCLKQMSDPQYQPYANNTLASTLVSLVKEDVRAGDRSLLPEYFQWVGALPPKDILGALHTAEADVFAPLWMTASEDATAKIADDLFNGPNSPWNPVHRTPGSGHFSGEELAVSPLLSVPAFRQQLLRSLLDTTVDGTISVKEKQITIKRQGGSRGQGLSQRTDPLLPATDSPQDIRVCDYYANEISKLDGAPLFQIYWPVEVRDEALIRTKEFVELWGPRFDTTAPPHSRRFPGFGVYAVFSLPKLEQPGTADDVKQGRAIFSLGTTNPVRTVMLESFPKPAQWTTLKLFPLALNPESGEVIFDQDGEIWQAEEVEENGVWKRYYGFVGRHIIARVPAEEIEIKTPIELKPVEVRPQKK